MPGNGRSRTRALWADGPAASLTYGPFPCRRLALHTCYVSLTRRKHTPVTIGMSNGLRPVPPPAGMKPALMSLEEDSK